VLHLASFEKSNLSGAVVISSPIIIRDPYGKYLFLLPLINKINNLVKSFSGRENGFINFIKSEPENLQINYKHMPLKGIYELMKLINTLRRELKDVSCPILIMHADKDYEIDPESARIIYNSVKSSQKTLYFVKASNHVIINGNNPDIIEKILDFLKAQ
ncbi:alpha/beta hydrolase, partial [Candidatus Desantisbacteria bacterium]|nr:alpha/beta hydrolase [Candidatus Desantisbacteria bacterium]